MTRPKAAQSVAASAEKSWQAFFLSAVRFLWLVLMAPETDRRVRLAKIGPAKAHRLRGHALNAEKPASG